MDQVTTYLIHFERPYKHAQHYAGSTVDLPARLALHRNGNGNPLMEAVTSAGIPWHVVRTWQGREAEAYLKRAQKNRVFCPICTKKPRERRP